MKIKIIKVSDSLLWYNNKIGQVFTPYREYPESYLVRATDGYSNIVYKTDSEIILKEETDANTHG